VPGTLGSQWQLPQYELTPIPGYQAAGAPSGGTATGNSGTPSLPDYSQIDDIIQQINATNQQAQQSALGARIPGGPALEAQSSQDIAGLLNPPTQFGEIDVPAAAAGVASGTVGSPFAGITGINLSETERLRRIGMGQQYLSAALARNPAAPIADPQALFQFLQQQAQAATQAQTQREFEAAQNAAQRALQAYLGQLSAARQYGGGGGGRPSTAPRLPTQYTRPGAPMSQTNIPALPDYSAAGPPSATTYPPFTFTPPENWEDLTGIQQSQYGQALEANPYYGLPDEANPYE
jgi:hypothetical protein